MKQEITFPESVNIKEILDLTEDVLLVSGEIKLSFQLEEYEGLRADHRFFEFQKTAKQHPGVDLLSFYLKDPSDLSENDYAEYREKLEMLLKNAKSQ